MYSKLRSGLFGGITAVALALTVLSGSAQAATTGKAGGPSLSAVDAQTAPDRIAGAGAVESPEALAALARIQERIADHVATHGTEYTFGSYLDPATGEIVLETDAPASLVAELTDLSGAPAAQQRVASQVRVSHGTTADLFHRRDDIQPFWGGAGITQSGSGTCSAGYAAETSGGSQVSVTAGHCFPVFSFPFFNFVQTESLNNNFGLVTLRRLASVTGHPMDFELIGGSSYAGRVYTGGVTSTSSLPVVAAGGAFVGYDDYCHSGRTTGENCGHTATSITAQVCTGTGCKQPVIAFTGGVLPQPGDSGGAFYAKTTTSVWIRGNVIAVGGGTAYAQPWTVIANEANISIVTG